MFLIMSGAYVGQELESEFGKIPPSFLPLGNRRLFQHQVALAPEGVDVFLSVPESFPISPIDKAWLQSNNVSILSTSDGLNLGVALVAALNISGQSLDKPLHVLYGDTLYSQLPAGDDIASISHAKDSYNWAVLTDDTSHWLKDNKTYLTGDSKKIIDGYFKFSNPREIIKCITQSEWSFIDGVNRYHKIIGLTAVEAKGWLDFGHVNTYYRSKADFTTQRAFNELTITPEWIEKSSIKNDKISAEAKWFAELPNALRGHIPQYLGRTTMHGRVSYRLEYLHLTALNELFVFSKLPSHIWTQILSSCIDFLSRCLEHKSDTEKTSNTLDVLFTKKTAQRLSEYCRDQNVDVNKKWHFNGSEKLSLKEVIQDSETHLPKDNKTQTVLHGDFCFSNILYDFRAGKIKIIDPRGITPSGEMTIYGDIRYDVAKISHSILGLYDWIVAGYCKVEITENDILLEIADEKTHKDTQQFFINLINEKFKLSPQNLYAMQIQLFISMLPLHADDTLRQQALFANVFRLHQILIRLEQ
jgi:hypothetical protein